MFLVFSLYNSNVVFFAHVSADVTACMCAWTAVSAVASAYTQPCVPAHLLQGQKSGPQTHDHNSGKS